MSTISQDIITRIENIQRIVENDIGKRGISNIGEPGQLLQMAQNLMQPSVKSVAVITGFYIMMAQASETDGPLGALSIIKSLLALGKRAVLVTDENNAVPLRRCLEYLDLQSRVPLVVFPTPKGETNTADGAFSVTQQELQVARDLAFDTLRRYDIDHVLAIERSGPNEQNKFHNMRGMDISHLCGRTEALFDVFPEYVKQSGKQQFACTSGIGDGGNELGMGKKIDIVKRDVPKGDVIACRVASDVLVAAGVSNWGGYALSAALYLLSQRAEGVAPVIEYDRNLLKFLVQECGAVDGPTGKRELMVDSFDYEEVHVPLIQSILDQCK